MHRLTPHHRLDRLIRPALSTTLFTALCFLQSSCALLGAVLQKPNVSFKDVKITDLSFSGIGALFVLNVDNPNPIGLDLAHLDYQLTVDNHQFAAGNANQAVSVPANGSGLLNLPVSIKFADFVQSIESLFTKDTLPYSIATTAGFASPIGTIDIPLSTSGTFPVPKVPTISMGSASMGSVDMSGATLNMGLNLTNRNAFALPVGALNYKVSVAGSPLVENIAQPGSLPANGTSPLPIAVRLDFTKAGMGVLRAVQSGNATIAFDGSLDLGFYKLPVHLEQAVSR